jgi:hypothetical protein
MTTGVVNLLVCLWHLGSAKTSSVLGIRILTWFTASRIIALTSIVALVFAAWQIRRARKLAQIQHLLQIDREFTGEALVSYRTELARKRLKGEAEPMELYRVLDFFETIGLLVRRGYLDAYDVWSMYSHWMFNVYADFKSLISEYRLEDSSYYAEFASLLKELERIEHQESGKLNPPTKEEIDEFWEEEGGLKPGSRVPRKRRKPSEKHEDSIRRSKIP